jgi:hypothetical protein
MASIKLQGDVSGELTISAPAVAGTNTLTLPASTGTLATTADIPAGYTDTDALTLFNASGSAPVYACRAWVNFNGTGTVAIRDSGNVSSITDNGLGDYTVTLTTAMPDTNGTVVGAAVETVGSYSGGQRVVVPSFASVSTIRAGVTFQNGGGADCPYVGIQVIR